VVLQCIKTFFDIYECISLPLAFSVFGEVIISVLASLGVGVLVNIIGGDNVCPIIAKVIATIPYISQEYMSIKPFPFTFDAANNIIIKNNNCDNSKNTNSMRVPRVVPDLRLAENYVPGVIALVKGLCYTSLCVFGHYDDNGHGNLMKALPLVILYYDHIIFRTTCINNNSKSSILYNFIDCTSISTDIIAGTVAAHFTSFTTTTTNYASLWCWFICLIWVFHGSGHIFNVNEFIPKSLSHLATACLVLSMFLFWDVDEDVISNNNNNALLPFSGIAKNNNNNFNRPPTNNNNSTSLNIIRLSQPSSFLASVDLFPYYARSISYLSLVIVDIYTLRPPLQRERDRIGMLRYGAVLFAPTTTMILACAFCLLGVLTIKIYIEYFSKESAANNNIGENNNNTNNNNNSASLLFYEKNHALSKINAGHGSITANNSVNNSGLFGNNYSNNNNNNGGENGGNNNNSNDNNNNNVKVNVFQQQPKTTIDAMDAQEAFRLAKLRYMDGRASV